MSNQYFELAFPTSVELKKFTLIYVPKLSRHENFLSQIQNFQHYFGLELMSRSLSLPDLKIKLEIYVPKLSRHENINSVIGNFPKGNFN